MEQSASKELVRIRHVSDMMVTAHATLQNEFATLALISDGALFVCSLGLCVLAFVDSTQLLRYTHWLSPLKIALFSAATLVYSAIASSLDWKVRSHKHETACKAFLEFKFLAKDLIDRINKGEQPDASSILTKYHTLTPTLISIPDSKFLRLKKKHLVKVFISNYLDDHPGTWIWLIRTKLWFRDNWLRVPKASD